ncbi:TPA: hypothetical protein ACIVHN_004922 [Salmonella enterica subsp. enterica serovar Kentucky]
MITGGDLRQSRLDVGYKTFTISPWVEQQGAVSEDINRSIINIRDAADTNVQTGQNNLQSAKSVAQLTSALSELAKQFWEKRG